MLRICVIFRIAASSGCSLDAKVNLVNKELKRNGKNQKKTGRAEEITKKDKQPQSQEDQRQRVYSASAGTPQAPGGTARKTQQGTLRAYPFKHLCFVKNPTFERMVRSEYAEI
jgi:hypothetical protein